MTNKQFNSFNKKIGELANENDLLIRVNGLQRQKIKKLEEENEQLRTLLKGRQYEKDIAKETEPKKYDKAYAVEDDILWEVFGDGYSKAEVIWDKENICELLNKLYEENERLKQGFNELLEVHTKVMQTLCTR